VGSKPQDLLQNGEVGKGKQNSSSAKTQKDAKIQIDLSEFSLDF
jgi:hypothetical protein